MSKTRISILGMAICLSANFSLGQTQKHSHFNPQNAREGENVEYCQTHTKRAELLLNPQAAAVFQQDEVIRQQELLNPILKSQTLYIPVVFHLLHNNGVEHISDDQIRGAIDILNRDYDLQNADAANVVTAFNASNPNATTTPTDADIQFRLATKAPDGTCFTGITHTVSSESHSGDGGNQLNAIINGNDVYQGEWPGDRYLNIFICGDIGGAAGYTYYPSNWLGASMANGIYVLHSYCGSTGTSSNYTSRTLTHEVGHWLNLAHPWGSTNDPGLASNCNTDDGVEDTPECIGLTSCSLSANSCSGDNAYWGFDQIDNTENYMDYSYCSKMFTGGQVNRMRNALNSSLGGRNNLSTPSNLALTGATGNLSLCGAEFSADRTSVCTGEQIQFSDQSFNSVAGWTWNFPGGTPANSTDQNPAITYSTPGVYEVSLTATDGTNNATETKTSYIRVLPAPASLPFVEGFESYPDLNNLVEWEVKNPNGQGFELENNLGHNSSKSVRLKNFGQGNGSIDELISAPVDLSGISSNVTLSFRYAYKRRNSGDDDFFRVYITNDCGSTWGLRKTLHGFFLSSDTQVTPYTPSLEEEWVTVHLTNITNNFFVENFRYKFNFEAGGGNNFYLDNINIYPGSPSDGIVASIEDIQEFGGLSVYPNPVDDELNIEFSTSSSVNTMIEIQDLTGKVVQRQSILANAGVNKVFMNTQELSSGMYFLNILSGNTKNTAQFIVK